MTKVSRFKKIVMKKRLTTKQKTTFLQKYLNKWCQSWIKIHPENISGFRIDKKVIKSGSTRNYAIVFHVVKKIKKEEIKDNRNSIPPYFKIKFPDGKTRKIKTDVEETGKFKFHVGIGEQVNSDLNIGNHGSAGLFLKDGNDRVFLLTNYHVVAKSLMDQDIYTYKRPAAQTQNNVTLTDSNGISIAGRFECGIISDRIDVAFVEFFISPAANLNSLPNGSTVQGYSGGYIPPNNKVIVYSFHNPDGQEAIIKNNTVIFSSGYDDIFINGVIALNLCTKHGDSGGLVLTSANTVLGIVVGGDYNYSYVIPYFKINNYNPLTII